MDIINININRFYNEAIRYKLGIIDNIKKDKLDMLSNFLEHCYINKNIYNIYKETIEELNNKINDLWI